MPLGESECLDGKAADVFLIVALIGHARGSTRGTAV